MFILRIYIQIIGSVARNTVDHFQYIFEFDEYIYDFYIQNCTR